MHTSNGLSPHDVEPDPYCNLLVVKIAERCNLNCSYCYMYNGGDKSYLKKPPVMSYEVIDAMMSRVLNHCQRHSLSEFTFVLHGGEPLIAPPKLYRYFTEAAFQVLGSAIKIRFALQTNGTLITDEWCDLFRELNIAISFSLDGPEKSNDLFRVDRGGRGSFQRVMKGWQIATSRGLEPGLLMVVNVFSDPLEIYALVKELRPKLVDFLLPDATHTKLPPALFSGDHSTPYADWLLTIFDKWTQDEGGGITIRMFLQIMRSILGERSDGYDSLGTGQIKVLIIESDGEIQPLDGLRFCEDGMASTEFNVVKNELDDAYAVPIIRLYHDAHENLCSACKTCDVRAICGGGFLPHRYSGNGNFDNPSVYCYDMKKLIRHVNEWFVPQLPPDLRQNLVVLPADSSASIGAS